MLTVIITVVVSILTVTEMSVKHIRAWNIRSAAPVRRDMYDLTY